MSLTDIFRELNNLEEKIICNICRMRCKDPVKIRICAHYFCESCLEKQSKEQICPSCKSCYNAQDICKNNLIREATPLLHELRDILLKYQHNEDNKCETLPKRNDPVASPSINKKPQENSSIDNDNQNENAVPEKSAIGESSSKDNILLFKEKIFKILFVDNLCTKTNAKGETALHIACKHKKLNDVQNLLKKHIDINMQDFAGWTPLHEAVEAKCLEIVELLIKQGALIDIPGGEYTTPLHKAATLDNENIVKMLLRYGADKNIIDYFGKTAEECATKENVKKLFQQEVAVEKPTHVILLDKKIVAYCYYVHPEYIDKLKNAKVSVLQKYDPKKLTHFIIRRTHKLSLNILLAMLEGCMIVPQEWIDDYLNNDFYVPITKYTFVNNETLNVGMRRAMLNELFKLPKLFDGINFYICDHRNPVRIQNAKFDKVGLSDLIKTGGGKVLQRAPTPSTCEGKLNYPYHAQISQSNFRCCHYIIYEEDKPPTLQYQMPEIKHRSSKWIVECIISFTILE